MVSTLLELERPFADWKDRHLSCIVNDDQPSIHQLADNHQRNSLKQRPYFLKKILKHRLLALIT